MTAATPPSQRLRPSTRRKRPWHWPLALAIAAGLAAPCIVSWAPPASKAVELKGSTYFLRPPSDVSLISYDTNVFTPRPDDYFTLQIPTDAGASLGGLTIQQIRGSDRQFLLAMNRIHAFLGRPRAEGTPVPVEVRFEAASLRFSLSFPQPVPPGSTLTVVLQPWQNPNQADTYLFEVQAYPAGPNPVAAPLGVGSLSIYSSFGR